MDINQREKKPHEHSALDNQIKSLTLAQKSFKNQKLNKEIKKKTFIQLN